MNKSQLQQNIVAPNKLYLNCKEATQIIVMKEVGPITFMQRIGLWYHLYLCAICKLFKIQSAEINQAIRKNEQEKQVQLSIEKKEEIRIQLNQLKSNGA